MTNPYISPTAPHALSERVPQWFQVIRTIALGIGGAGAILACLRFLLALTAPIAARCEMLGGVLLFLAGALLFIGVFAKRAGSRPRTNMVTPAIALLFCVSGCGWLANGCMTESAHRKRYNDIKANLKELGNALDAYEQRQENPSENGQ